jgi:hypothetical protein
MRRLIFDAGKQLLKGAELNQVDECAGPDAHGERRRGDVRRDPLTHHDRQRDDADRDRGSDAIHRREQQRRDQRNGHRGHQRPIACQFHRRTDHALRDPRLNEHLSEPGTEHDDDHRAGKLNAASLDDFFLDIVDADAGDGSPSHGKQQQHDDRTLPTDDQHDHHQKCNEQRNPCPKVHGVSFPVLRASFDRGLFAK